MTQAAKIRQAAKELKEFNIRDLSNAAGAQSYREIRAIRDSFRDFLRRGEMERIGRGTYRYIGIVEPLTIRQRLWDVARRLIRFSLKDLEQITDANLHTVKDFCGWLVKEGYAERVKPGRFRLVSKVKPTVPKRSKDT